MLHLHDSFLMYSIAKNTSVPRLYWRDRKPRRRREIEQRQNNRPRNHGTPHSVASVVFFAERNVRSCQCVMTEKTGNGKGGKVKGNEIKFKTQKRSYPNITQPTCERSAKQHLHRPCSKKEDTKIRSTSYRSQKKQSQLQRFVCFWRLFISCLKSQPFFSPASKSSRRKILQQKLGVMDVTNFVSNQRRLVTLLQRDAPHIRVPILHCQLIVHWCHANVYRPHIFILIPTDSFLFINNQIVNIIASSVLDRL